MLSTFLGNFYLFKTSFSNVVCYNQSADVAVMFESMDEVGISFAILKGWNKLKNLWITSKALMNWL